MPVSIQKLALLVFSSDSGREAEEEENSQTHSQVSLLAFKTKH